MASHGHVEYTHWLNVEPIQLRVLLCRCELIVEQFGVYSNNRLPSFGGARVCFCFSRILGIFFSLLFCGLNWILKNGLSCFRALFGWERECGAWKMPISVFIEFFFIVPAKYTESLNCISSVHRDACLTWMSALFESSLRIYILKVLFIQTRSDIPFFCAQQIALFEYIVGVYPCKHCISRSSENIVDFKKQLVYFVPSLWNIKHYYIFIERCTSHVDVDVSIGRFFSLILIRLLQFRGWCSSRSRLLPRRSISRLTLSDCIDGQLKCIDEDGKKPVQWPVCSCCIALVSFPCSVLRLFSCSY